MRYSVYLAKSLSQLIHGFYNTSLYFAENIAQMAYKENISESLLFDRKYFDGERRAMEWLYTAYHAYARLKTFRDMRAECKNYSYGRQYSKLPWSWRGH